jgi:hypothetical protein
MKVFGFKGFKLIDGKLNCRGVVFEVGKEYKISGELELCKNGFHFCTELENVNNYYRFSDEFTVVGEIEAISPTVTEGDKSCTNIIKIVRIIPQDELMILTNKGDNNIGYFNEGNFNVGNDNVGSCNKGNCNEGSFNVGDDNEGDDNVGDDNVGNRNKGDNNKGDNNKGNKNKGDDNVGNNNVGNRNKGDNNKGNKNKGNGNKGDDNVGNNNVVDYDQY